jgi:hypothetical protein
MMVQTLQQFGYSGEAHADVSSQIVLRGGGRVILIVLNGTVTSCLILNKKGQKLYHDAKAQSISSRLGELEWKLISSAPTKTSMTVGPPQITQLTDMTSSCCPRRIAVPQAQMSSWPVSQRSAYLLADGTRSIEQIARLLSRPSSVIEQTVHTLQALGAIEK